MNQKEQNLINKLLELYAQLYPVRHLFRAKQFPYTPEEAEEIIKGLSGSADVRRKVPAGFVRNEIKDITTVEQVRDYIEKEGLFAVQDEDAANSKNAADISLAEYKHLYSILYTTPIKSKVRKQDLANDIVKYFDGIDRAKSLKP